MSKCKTILKTNPRHKYRQLCGQLDALGFVVYINRVDSKCYNFIVNGGIKKVYKQRSSCNRQIEKMYNQSQKK